jgi:hypothetical protein
LRVRLKGVGENRTGVGGQMRLRFGEKWGPAREVHAGSGYWSEDGSVQVLGTPDIATEIEVKWPGGKNVTYKLPADAKEVQLSPNGEVQKVR